MRPMSEKPAEKLPQPGDEEIPGDQRREPASDKPPTEGPGGPSVDEPTDPALEKDQEEG